MQWIMWYCILILIIPPLLKKIQSRILTYIKRRKIRNIKCNINIILTWKFQLEYIVINPLKNVEWIIRSRLQLRLPMHSRNIFFLICTQTQSPGLKITNLLSLLALNVYCSFFFSICCWTLAWSFFTISMYFALTI